MTGNEKRITLMVLLVSMPVGGVETQIAAILDRLDRAKYNICVCCIKEPGALGAAIRNSGIEVISLNAMKSSRFSIKIAHQIAAVMKRKDVRVLWTHQYVANLYGRIATLLFRPSVVLSTFHALYDKPKLHRSMFNRFLAGRADALVAVSGAVAADMARYDHTGSDRVKIIYNGVDIRMFDIVETKKECRKQFGLPEQDVLIGTVGRVSKEKNQAVILDALGTLPRTVKGVIAGDGPLRTKLEQTAQDRCFFLGHVEHASIPYVMKAMDIFCFPSLWEGFGISLAEAMASGLPVVASDIPSHREVLGDAALFFSPERAGDLAAALMELIQDTAHRERLREKSRMRAENFSIESTVAAYENIIHETLSKKGRNG